MALKKLRVVTLTERERLLDEFIVTVEDANEVLHQMAQVELYNRMIEIEHSRGITLIRGSEIFMVFVEDYSENPELQGQRAEPSEVGSEPFAQDLSPAYIP